MHISEKPLPQKGEKFGRLTIVKSALIHGRIFCRCNCDCGTTGHIVDYKSLQPRPDPEKRFKGRAQSCGCLRRERMIQFNKDRAKQKQSA